MTPAALFADSLSAAELIEENETNVVECLKKPASGKYTPR
jgi:hypothetical protein